MNFINYNDNIYVNFRKIKLKEHNEDFIRDLKDYWHCDTCLRGNDGYYHFCNKVVDVEIIEEKNNLIIYERPNDTTSNEP
jgi:hypothetical protein